MHLKRAAVCQSQSCICLRCHISIFWLLFGLLCPCSSSIRCTVYSSPFLKAGLSRKTFTSPDVSSLWLVEPHVDPLVFTCAWLSFCYLIPKWIDEFFWPKVLLFRGIDVQAISKVGTHIWFVLWVSSWRTMSQMLTARVRIYGIVSREVSACFFCIRFRVKMVLQKLLDNLPPCVIILWN